MNRIGLIYFRINNSKHAFSFNSNTIHSLVSFPSGKHLFLVSPCVSDKEASNNSYKVGFVLNAIA